MNIVSDYTGNQRMPQSLFQSHRFLLRSPTLCLYLNFNENDSEIYC